jgi:hypothetical protein
MVRMGGEREEEEEEERMRKREGSTVWARRS